MSNWNNYMENPHWRATHLWGLAEPSNKYYNRSNFYNDGRFMPLPIYSGDDVHIALKRYNDGLSAYNISSVKTTQDSPTITRENHQLQMCSDMTGYPWGCKKAIIGNQYHPHLSYDTRW